MSSNVFSSRELGLSTLFAFLLQGAFIGLLAFAGDSRGAVIHEEKEVVNEVAIAVLPMIDDRPLLKLGSKKREKARLPDMWRKRAPRAVKRYEERSAPSEKAVDEVKEIPESKLADLQHEAPPEDAEIVEKVDDEILEEETPAETPELNEEGEADGSEEGTETDFLKARTIDLYGRKLASWLSSRFRPDMSAIPCEVLKGLSARISVQVGSGRLITGTSVRSLSGNATFDAKAQAYLSSLPGKQLPPPPPLYPDILPPTVHATLIVPCQ